MMEFLSSPFFEVVKTIFDIIIVAYLIYFLYSLFQDTNSITIVKGFLFIMAINIVANFIGLKTVAWVFRYLVENFVILVVVLFQPEIRRLLSRVGRSGLSAIREKISQEVLGEIARAVYNMSDDKTGALIIIERNVGLRDLVDESVSLDASVKAELLHSIFFKKNLLHDGAVLIESDKIVAARVIIPNIIVSAPLKTKRRLGTRHRAALAITQDTDAVSVIVSEETGKVSIAHNGKLEYDLSQEKFLRRLNEIVVA
jgi:diadenylate cyclase